MRFLGQEIGDDREIEVRTVNSPHIAGLFQILDQQIGDVVDAKLNTLTQDRFERMYLKQSCVLTLAMLHNRTGRFTILISELDSILNELLSETGLAAIRNLHAHQTTNDVAHHPSPLNQAQVVTPSSNTVQTTNEVKPN